MKEPNVNLILTLKTNLGQYVKVGDKVNTDKYKNCNEIFIISSGDSIFAGYAVSWCGFKDNEIFDCPVNLYYSDDRIHIVSFQTSVIDYNGKTYSFLS